VITAACGEQDIIGLQAELVVEGADYHQLMGGANSVGVEHRGKVIY
jgi:hypothetical protein